MADLPTLRQDIDAIDCELVRLLNERATVALNIGQAKRLLAESSGDATSPAAAAATAHVYAPGRERAVFDKVQRLNRGPLSNAALASIYREVISAAISLQKELCIGYLGPAGTYTHQAACRRFGDSVLYVPLDSIADVFGAVADGKVSYGVVPLENSTIGAINQTFDCLLTSSLRIRSETYLPIVHCLLALSGTAVHSLKRVYSHSEALAQCRRFVDSELHSRNIEVVPVASTAMAARMASQDVQAGAICGAVCASLYPGLAVIRDAVQDRRSNVTRFCVLSDASDAPTGHDKTLISITVNMEKPGSLCDALAVFKHHDISLTNMTSRPLPPPEHPVGSSGSGNGGGGGGGGSGSNDDMALKSWEYVFFLEFCGHALDGKVQQALADLQQHCSFVKHCGSFVDERK